MKFTAICHFSDDHSDITLLRTLEDFTRQNQGLLDHPDRIQAVQVEPATQPGVPGGGVVKPDVTDAEYILTRVCQPESVFCLATAENVSDILRAVHPSLRRREASAPYAAPVGGFCAGNPDPGSLYWRQQLDICTWLIDEWQRTVLNRAWLDQ